MKNCLKYPFISIKDVKVIYWINIYRFESNEHRNEKENQNNAAPRRYDEIRRKKKRENHFFKQKNRKSWSKWF